MEVNGPKLKLTVGKLLEASYSANRNLTVSIISEGSSAQLTVDSKGNATLTGVAGVVAFDGTPVLNSLGVNYKRLSVSFRNRAEMKIGYHAAINLSVLSVTANGSFDLEELITSCSGLLCKAARALKGRNRAYENELQQIMGY